MTKNFSVFQNDGFQHLVEHLDPHYQLPNWHFISDTAVERGVQVNFKIVSNGTLELSPFYI